jgi:ribonuclease HI
VLIDGSRPDAKHPDAPPLAVIARPLGMQTNNFAEYTAVVLALRRAHELGAEEVELVLDSKLIVEQLSGRWKVRHPIIARLAAQAQAELRTFRTWSIRHEPRANNRAADALANLALDDPGAAAAAEAGAFRTTEIRPPDMIVAPDDLAWSDFAARAPDLAAAGERLFRAFTVGYLATLRSDGAPRVHQISISLTDGRLYIFVIAGSRRADDLAHDPRYALHSFPHSPTDDGWDDEEFEIEGLAHPVGAAAREAIAAAHTDSAGPTDALFELRVGRAHWKWRHSGRAVVRHWPL